MKRVRVIGLTGGVGCGKSAVGEILQRNGVPVLDTDAVAFDLLQPGSSVLEQVIATFGETYRNGLTVDRKKLGSLVFSNRDALAKLNAIMHPVIFREMHRWIEQTLLTNDHVVVMIPLLFETGAERWCGKVLTVAADALLVQQRLAKRGWSEQEAQLRMNAQWPLGEKIKKADAVLWNNDSLDVLNQNTMRIWNDLISGKEEEL